MKNKTKFLFPLLLLIISQPNLSAQNISIDFNPIEDVCSLDTEDCLAALSYPFSLFVEDATGMTVSYKVSFDGTLPVEDEYGTLSGTYPDYSISGEYPIGNHSFEVTAIQGSDTLVTDMDFNVVDCVVVPPICINGLTTSITVVVGYGFQRTVYFSSFIANFTEDCSGSLNYSIHRDGDVENGINPITEAQDSIIVDCGDLGAVLIDIYVWDNAFNPYAVQPDGTVGGPNYDYCATYFLVGDPGSYCNDENFISLIEGTNKTEDGYGIEGVEVQITNGAQYFNTLTNAEGAYSIEVPNSGDFTIKPYYLGYPLNGISTFDMILIAKYILGTQSLDSPYQIIAADINASGTVTVADLIQLRKRILGIYTSFPNNAAWRFVDADYVFPDPTNPWLEEFPEEININNPNGDYLENDFIGIQIGNMNGW